jgi:NAD(P)-dependent dehydrogenase (short-subunit alcohol dehydrogenase family)
MQKNIIWLEDKVILVTGWTSWMWEATVRAAVHNGAKVAFLWRREAEGKKIVDDVLSEWVSAWSIAFLPCDVTDFDNLAESIHHVCSIWGRIDSLFCCAWTHIVGDILSTTLEQWNRLWNTDVTSMFITLQNVLPQMIKQWWWNIVLMWSDQSLIGKKKSAIYGAAKAAIWQLTKSTALDYAEYNIRVNAVCPGTIDTPQAARAAQTFATERFGWDIDKARDDFANAQAIKRLWKPEEVANLVCFLLSNQAAYMTGALVSIDGGYTAG